MRPALDAMRRAGIRRARFSALYGGRTAAGHVVLNDIETPLGDWLDHIWIRNSVWSGFQCRHGLPISVIASIEPYWRADGSMELGLFGARVIP